MLKRWRWFRLWLVRMILPEGVQYVRGLLDAATTRRQAFAGNRHAGWGPSSDPHADGDPIQRAYCEGQQSICRLLLLAWRVPRQDDRYAV